MTIEELKREWEISSALPPFSGELEPLRQRDRRIVKFSRDHMDSLIAIVMEVSKYRDHAVPSVLKALEELENGN